NPANKNYKHSSFEMSFFEWFIVFLIASGIIALERFTSVDINSSFVRLILYMVSASLFSFWIGWIFFGFKAVRKRKIIFLAVVGLCVLKAYLTWGGDWKTQTILYANKLDESKTIEFQMRGDWYAFGYKKRIVERKKIIPFLDYITDVDTMKIDKSSWKRIDKKVNELKLHNFNDIPSD
ncbi:MAG TPA: hypothetical protein PKN96_09630, partial [Flavobacterium sp.]|uniref:hypothetical protein n=1 Tax=Flavobacterium sp. TaxID=239 RepID=UPI002BED01CE